MRRLCGLQVFRGGDLPERLPELKVRRASRRPNRVGFAVPGEWRISVTAYPGIRTADAQEVLLHELVHLEVGTEPGHRRWHGRRFREVLRRAMRDAYGISGVRARGALHGAYADAIERRRAAEPPQRRRGPLVAEGQLELPLTG